MPRFLHTADWQIGRQYSQFSPDDAVALASARLEVVETIARLATEHKVDAILVAGDVFDAQTVAERTIRKLFNAMQGFSGPWIMIPGNHDAALTESVWTQAKRLTVSNARPNSGTRKSTASSTLAFLVRDLGTVHHQPSCSSVMFSARMARNSDPLAPVQRYITTQSRPNWCMSLLQRSKSPTSCALSARRARFMCLPPMIFPSLLSRPRMMLRQWFGVCSGNRPASNAKSQAAPSSDLNLAATVGVPFLASSVSKATARLMAATGKSPISSMTRSSVRCAAIALAAPRLVIRCPDT
ncbi:MAG: metallophosphoesterase [Rhodoferax sp.]|nr:metallophosphoesterase [Rhodoferax sp.]